MHENYTTFLLRREISRPCFSTFFVGTGDDRLRRAPLCPAADANFTPMFAVPFGATPPELPPRAPTLPSEASATLLPTGCMSTAYGLHLYSDVPTNSR